MDFNILWAYSLSELSFAYLTKNYGDDEKKLIRREIGIRFLNNGCDFNAFISKEANVINKRGEDINEYLIKGNPKAEDLFRVFFDYSYHENYEDRYLLLSEIMLCNNTSKRTFFTKCINLELKNLKYRIEKNPKNENLERLESAYIALYKRYHEDWYSPKSNSLVYAFNNIIPSGRAIMSDELEQKQREYLEKFPEGCIRYFIIGFLIQSDTIDAIKVRGLINEEMIRLGTQKESIISSLKNNKFTDYSDINVEKRKIKILKR